MKVWVIISDCGLSGPWIHAVRSTKPLETDEELMHRYVDSPPHSNGGRPTGYQFTSVEEFEIDAEPVA